MQLCPPCYTAPSAVRASLPLLDGCKKFLTNVASPKLRIILDDRYPQKTCTTSSSVSGRVTIETPGKSDLRHIDVYLVGSAKTCVDKLDVSKTTTHCFLRLDMPVPAQFSISGTHDIPFTFTIPERLPHGACQTSSLVDRAHISDYHLSLPPTVASSWDRDDLSPVMARIEYRIVARAQISTGSQGRFVESTQPIHVLPVLEEAPPMDIRDSDQLYNLTKSAMLRSQLGGGHSGRIVVSASQPRAVSLSPDTKTATTTFARLKLKFEAPDARVVPPSAMTVSSRITAYTHFSSDHVDCLPNLGDCRTKDVSHRHGTYSTSVRCFSAPIANIDWKRQTRSHPIYRNYWEKVPEKRTWIEDEKQYLLSALHAEEVHIHEVDEHLGSQATYPVSFTTVIDVPVLLPTDKKTFIPSFHSCIASRYYALKINVVVAKGLSATTLTLALPLEIVVQRPKQAI